MPEFNTRPRDPHVARLMAPKPGFEPEPLPPRGPAIDHAERALRVQAMQFAIAAEGASGVVLALAAADKILTFLRGGTDPTEERADG